jgi:hypothetical protein
MGRCCEEVSLIARVTLFFGQDLALQCIPILYIFAPKHPPSLGRSCVPSLISVHHCSSIVDLGLAIPLRASVRGRVTLCDFMSGLTGTFFRAFPGRRGIGSTQPARDLLMMPAQIRFIFGFSATDPAGSIAIRTHGQGNRIRIQVTARSYPQAGRA